MAACAFIIPELFGAAFLAAGLASESSCAEQRADGERREGFFISGIDWPLEMQNPDKVLSSCSIYGRSGFALVAQKPWAQVVLKWRSLIYSAQLTA